MAETSPSLYHTLAALALTAALAGCAATHVGDDWQCPLAQGEVCTSIAAADPAVAPDAAPPPLATRTPLYRAPESEAEAGPEAEPESTTKPGTKARPCAEGCNPLAWLGRLLAPHEDTAETAENTNAASTAPVERTPAPVATDQADDVPCGAEEQAPKPAAAPMDADDDADDTDTPCAIATDMQETTTPAPIVAAEPIASSTAAVIPCGTDDAPAEPAVEADVATDVPTFDDAKTPCADPALVEETASEEAGEPYVSIAVNAERGGVEVTTDEDVTAAAVIADAPPSTAAPLLPPPPAPDALRTGEVVGRIWIAPFVDAGGVYREGAWVRAVLAPAGWRR